MGLTGNGNQGTPRPDGRVFPGESRGALFCPNCGAQAMEGDLFCRQCGKRLTFAQGPVPQQPFGTDPVCPACGNPWIEGDRYCRYCGAIKDEPQYVLREFACIYGPAPRLREHRCRRCGHTWQTMTMIDNELFCPECGGPAPAEDVEGR